MSNVISGTLIWISDENSSDNIQMFQLLQSSVYTELWTFLLLLCYPANEKAGDTQGAGRGHS